MISIIIPVYNTEKYLARCIDSVLASTYSYFEIILINDGSDDRSLEICREYGDRDSRIKVITQENQGVSAARNRGIKESSGEWIVFVDSDDVISCDFLAAAADRRWQDADIIFFDYSGYKETGNVKGHGRVHDCTPSAYYYGAKDRLLIIRKMLCAKNLTDDTRTSLLSPCAKAYKRSLIMKHAISFSEDIIIGEDRLFNLEYYFWAQKYVHISRTVYYVTWRVNSLTHCYQMNLVENYYIFHRKLREFMKAQGIFEDLEDAYFDTVQAGLTDILIYGIFNPRSTRTYSERRRLCRNIRDDEIVRLALGYQDKKGNFPRRVLLFLFAREYFGMVNLVCKLSYFLLRRLKR